MNLICLVLRKVLVVNVRTANVLIVNVKIKQNVVKNNLKSKKKDVVRVK
jgi:hypothetical protein